MSEKLSLLPGPPSASCAVLARFGHFRLNSQSGELSYRGKKQQLPKEQCIVMHLVLAAGGSAVREDALLVALGRLDAADGLDHLWACVTLLNNAIYACSAGYGYVAHFPLEGFALVIARARAREVLGLPPSSKNVIGREDVAERVQAKLIEHRFVTIVGPGGIGKTTVAGMVTLGLGSTFPDGVCFIDAAPLAEPRLLPNALAQALGVSVVAGAVQKCLAAFVKDKEILVVLDSCEHLIGEAAALAEQLLQAAPNLKVLATSREPLMASGEWLLHLGEIGLPPLSGGLIAAKALEYPAVQLFVERVREHNPDFVLDDGSAAHVCSLCHRLDGIPLAIELAAARLELLGLEGLIDQVSYRLLVQQGTVRSAQARHETLSSMLDWSYDLLPWKEQQALIRLSVFRGEFTLLAAVSVLADDEAGADDDSAECVFELLMKSLLSFRDDAGVGRYRLFDTTRAYAAAKLDAVGERGQQQYRHARCLCELMRSAHADWLEMPREQWLSTYRGWIDDIRVAVDWAFAPGGDPELGATLILAAFPLAHQVSLTAEFADRVAHAISIVEPGSMTSTLLQIQKYALTCNVNSALDPENSGLNAAVLAAEHAEVSSPLYQYRTFLRASQWAASFLPGDFPAALQQVESMRQQAAAAGDCLADIVGRRMHAQSLHFLGRDKEAQVQAEFVLANARRRIPLVGSPAQLDTRVSMRIVLARIAYIRGNITLASQLCHEALRYAADDTAAAQAQVLSLCAIPIAIWSGDEIAARQLVHRLGEHAQTYSLHMWSGWADLYRDVVASIAGDEHATARILNVGVSALHNTQRDHLATFSPHLLAPDSLARAEGGMVGWCAAEVFRANAAIHLKRGERASASALLFRALQTARTQAALYWELRAASSLANLWHQDGRGTEGRALLEPLLGRFPSGSDTSDLRRAQALLAAC